MRSCKKARGVHFVSDPNFNGETHPGEQVSSADATCRQCLHKLRLDGLHVLFSYTFQWACPPAAMCPHTTIYVSSHYSICVPTLVAQGLKLLLKALSGRYLVSRIKQ